MQRIKALLKRLDPQISLLFIALVLLGLETTVLHLLRPLERRTQDVFTAWHANDRSPDSGILLLSIDERTLEQMSSEFGFYPWPRSVYGELLEGILPHGPRAVVFDILFSDPDIEHTDADAYFMNVASDDPRVYFPLVRLTGADDEQGAPLAQIGDLFELHQGPNAAPDARLALLPPLEPLALTGRLGLINFFPDPDGVGRRYLIYLEAEGWRLPSLPARVMRDLGHAVPEQPFITLNWNGRPEHRPRVSLVDMLRDVERREPGGLAASVKGKIVVIGATAPQLHDIYVTPISGVHPGMDILATALDNLKNEDWLREAPEWIGVLAAALLIIVLAVLFARVRGPLWGGVLLLLVTPAAFGAGLLAVSQGRLVPVVLPLMFGWLFYVAHALREYLRERKARQHAVRVFSRFLDPRVVTELVKEGRNLLDARGDSRIVTVLFSDIRGFTTLSETRPPEEIVALLNAYFSRQVEVIFRHGGTVDKFIGDAIMAFWGAPLTDARQAENAVRAALEMAAVVDEFRAGLGDLGQAFDIGIGIHTGPAVVGFIGAENKLDYTAIGDTVNLASRIEGQTKGRCRILVSEDTCNQCAGRFAYVSHGAVQVKGRSRMVNLYEPVRSQ